VTLFDAAELSELDDVIQVTGSVSLQGDLIPAIVAFPYLQKVGSLTAQGASNLATLSLPRLTQAGPFNLLQDARLESLALPSLSTVGNLTIAQTGLKSLTAFDPRLGAALESAGNLSFKGNPALPICAGPALANDLRGWAGALVNDGNLACSCAGLACCAGAECQ